jgi:hypothetical protein
MASITLREEGSQVLAANNILPHSRGSDARHSWHLSVAPGFEGEAALNWWLETKLRS